MFKCDICRQERNTKESITEIVKDISHDHYGEIITEMIHICSNCLKDIGKGE